MTRICLGLVTLLALSSAVSIVNAHEGHDHAQQKFNIPGDEDYSTNAPDLQDFKVIKSNTKRECEVSMRKVVMFIHPTLPSTDA